MMHYKYFMIGGYLSIISEKYIKVNVYLFSIALIDMHLNFKER